MKLATYIYLMSGYCWKGFQGQRSEVRGQRSRSRVNSITAEAYISTVWRQDITCSVTHNEKAGFVIAIDSVTWGCYCRSACVAVRCQVHLAQRSTSVVRWPRLGPATLCIPTTVVHIACS